MSLKSHSTDPDVLETININGTTLGWADWSKLDNTSADAVARVFDGKVDFTSDVVIDGINVGQFMKSLGERFLILEADFKKHEQYPALKDAYDQYKMLEKLLMENSNGNLDQD